LLETGSADSLTIKAIETFQKRVMRTETPDGRVDPNGRTLQALRDGSAVGLTEASLQGILIGATAANVKRFYEPLRRGMLSYDIVTPLRVAHFIAQLGHESGDFRYTEEIASGSAYEGRADLGNTQKGDGVRFKGRGLIQLTGRANYTQYGAARGRDYVTGVNPQLLSTDAFVAVDVACWFWSTRNINPLADADDIVKVTKRINGGTNGLADRRAKLVRAKFFLVNRQFVAPGY
jgi:putative chitinase